MKATKRIRDPRRRSNCHVRRKDGSKLPLQRMVICSDGVVRPTTSMPRVDGKYEYWPRQ